VRKNGTGTLEEFLKLYMLFNLGNWLKCLVTETLSTLWRVGRIFRDLNKGREEKLRGLLQINLFAHF